jgi:hypothetical protein
MNRRGFFKFLGVGAAAIVAPKVLASEPGNINWKGVFRELPPEQSLKEDFERKVKCIKSYLSQNGILTIFENPHKGCDYTIGIVTGNEINSPSCFSVMRVGKGDEPSVQVAEYVCNNCSSGKLVSYITYVSKQYMGNDSKGPLLVIEQVSSPGDCVQAMLKIMGFSRFYSTRRSNSERRKEGWYTTKSSAPIIMGTFTEAVKNGWYKPNSEQVKQCLGKIDEELRYNPYFMAAAQSYIGAKGDLG